MPDDPSTAAGERQRRGLNRLGGEVSPYLLQHADNPVDWYPWGAPAFEAARKADKPIFLSIGYSTCHWCHVMERESFEDDEVARALNDAFVCVKVDREERPDIDRVYMRVCQALTGGGGWPLTIVMTPEGEPFYAATYLPKQSRMGLPGLLDLAERVDEAWHGDRATLLRSAGEIAAHLRQSESLGGGGSARADLLDKGYTQLAAAFDEGHPGFGSAPKFPTPHNVLFLLRYYHRTANTSALRMAGRILTAMRAGGVYDQIGFGFHRYSTDRAWRVPHFEKMLYDQALLLMAYTQGYQVTGDGAHRRTAEEIVDYLLRRMRGTEGAFHSAEDADTEGREGAYYLWTAEEIDRALDKNEARAARSAWGIEDRGNLEGPLAHENPGANVLYAAREVREVASDLAIGESEARALLESARTKLLAVRSARTRPHLDDKVLTDWNGLTIAALAGAGAAFGREDYVDAASGTARFILETLSDDDGRLHHRYRSGEAGIAANLDDYAFLIWGLTELYEAGFDAAHLEEALRLADSMLERFAAAEGGALRFTAADAEPLIARTVDLYDGAVPSGNSVAAWILLRLSRMTGRVELEEGAHRILDGAAADLAAGPAGHTFMLTALDFAAGPSCEVVVAGDPSAADTAALVSALHGSFLPRAVYVVRPTHVLAPPIVELAEYTRPYASPDGVAAAYVCRDYACSAPVSDPAEMLELIRRPPSEQPEELQ